MNVISFALSCSLIVNRELIAPRMSEFLCFCLRPYYAQYIVYYFILLVAIEVVYSSISAISIK
jgi:hypothetical protein